MPPIEENIMVVLSSPSGVGKTTLTKKFNRSFLISKYQSPIQQDRQDQMR